METNIKKVDKAHLTSQTSPFKLGGKEALATAAGQSSPPIEESTDLRTGSSRPQSNKRPTSQQRMENTTSNAKSMAANMGAATNTK